MKNTWQMYVFNLYADNIQCEYLLIIQTFSETDYFLAIQYNDSIMITANTTA